MYRYLILCKMFVEKNPIELLFACKTELINSSTAKCRHVGDGWALGKVGRIGNSGFGRSVNPISSI